MLFLNFTYNQSHVEGIRISNNELTIRSESLFFILPIITDRVSKDIKGEVFRATVFIVI